MRSGDFPSFAGGCGTRDKSVIADAGKGLATDLFMLRLVLSACVVTTDTAMVKVVMTITSTKTMGNK